MNIVIIGAGSIGLLVAAKLADVPGANVTLVTRTAEQAKLLESGLLLTREDRTVRKELACISFAKAERTVQSLADQSDWVFLTTKQTHVDGPLIRVIAAMVNGGANLLCFQNGVGHVERLAEEGIPKELIYVAVTTEAAKKEAGNSVIHTGQGTTSIGSAYASDDTEQSSHIVKVLGQGGMNSSAVPDMHEIIWTKLLINSVINPLTAIMRVRNGELTACLHTVALMESLYHEACAVLADAGIRTSERLWDQLLDVCEKTAGNTSSMLQDLLNGRTSEIDWINGSIIRLARSQRLSVPTHEAVYQLVKGLEAQSRSHTPE